jgi:plasmid stability protein
MGSLTIPIDETTESRLRKRAARHGRSIEEEAREIIKCEVATEETGLHLADRIHRRFAELGGFELPEFPDEPVGDPPDFK